MIELLNNGKILRKISEKNYIKIVCADEQFTSLFQNY